jgi:hypothetical protein
MRTARPPTRRLNLVTADHLELGTGHCHNG